MTSAGTRLLRGERVAVLGASGFIGRWVARAVTLAGARALFTVRSAATADLLRGYGALGDLTELDVSVDGSVEQWVATHRPRVVFNLIGYGVDRSETDAGLAAMINATVPRRLAESLAALGDATLIHVGSAFEYGAVRGNLAEDGPAEPITLYGRTKLAGTLAVQQVAQQSGGALRASTARLFTVYGPGEHLGRLLPSLVGAASSRGALPFTAGQQRRDFTWVGDVADALVQLPGSGVTPGTIVNVASGRLQSVREFIEAATVVLGIDRERLQFGALETRAEEMAHEPVSTERLRGLLGRALPSDLSRGIRLSRDFRLEVGTPSRGEAGGGGR